MKQIEVQIMGQNYLLGCPENGEARLQEAVQKVDTAMCKIRDIGKIKARDRIAVLAALNLAFDLQERTAGDLDAPGAGQPQAPTASSEIAGDAAHPELSVLLQRLDTALGTDGRLL